MGLLDVAKGAGRAPPARRRRSGSPQSSSCCRARSESATSAKGSESRRRGERRARTQTLDLALRLAELWLRDMLCICEGAPELIHAVDRRAELEQDARAGDGGARVRAGDRAGARETRLSLALNVSEELALEALAYRLESAALSRHQAGRAAGLSAAIGPRLGSRP